MARRRRSRRRRPSPQLGYGPAAHREEAWSASQLGDSIREARRALKARDCGAALGHLVEAMRDLGMWEAHGVAARFGRNPGLPVEGHDAMVEKVQGLGEHVKACLRGNKAW